MAVLADKPEKADYTATLHPGSKSHRSFGNIVQITKPKLKSDKIEEFIARQKEGLADNTLRQSGWSNKFVCSTTTSAGKLPSCYKCRHAAIKSINSYTYNGTFIRIEECSKCADWTLDDTTKDILSYDAPKDYPTRELDDSPVPPPAGREIGLEKLELLKLSFPILVQAVRFAFFHSKGPQGTSWTKAMCMKYLNTCGLNTRQQELLYDAAMKAHSENVEVNYNDPMRIGDYTFPAAFCNDLELPRFIEALMHLLFLGVASSLVKLTNKVYLKSIGKGEDAFKQNIQGLLKALAPFNLSWLLILPFSGSKKTQMTTSTWVSENWLAFVRVMKISYFWFGKSGVEDERKGANDLFRVVISFTALVARILTHAGVNQSSTHLISLYIKEFLSSVNELDIRLRHKAINQKEGPVGEKGRKDTDQFWLKANFMSMPNLVKTMEELGPLVNYWDGGGKGERYIQEIKPHIPRGVREGGNFFVRLLEKIYKLDAMKRIEMAWKAWKKEEVDDSLSVESVESNDSSLGEEGGAASVASAGVVTVESEDDNSDASSVLTDTPGDMEWTSPMEDKHMQKARTIYIYKKRPFSNRPLQRIMFYLVLS